MTEGLGEFAHNGGDAEMPANDPPARRRRKKTPKPVGEGAPKRESGSWVAKSPSGELSVWTSQADARKSAIPNGRFLRVLYGDTLPVDSDMHPSNVTAEGSGVYMARNDAGEWAPFSTETPALVFATPDGAVIRLTNGGVIPR